MRRTPAFTASLAICLLLATLGRLHAEPSRGAVPAELPPPAPAAPEKLSLPPASNAQQPAAEDEQPPGDATKQNQAQQNQTKADQPAKGRDDAEKREPPPPDGRCDLCGGCECVRKVCVSKMTTKEIRKVCWDAKSEDFCVPGRSIWCGKVCRQDDCGCWTHDLWKPTCAEVLTRVVPVRKETKRTVPAVEWTVEERCSCCRRRPRQAVAAPAADGKQQNDGGDAERTAAQPRTLR